MPFITVYDYNEALTFSDAGYGPINEMDLTVIIQQEITVQPVSIITELDMVVRL